MNWNTVLGILTLVTVLVINPIPVHSDAEKINTDKTLYQSGETINISATVGQENSYEPVTVIIRDFNNKFIVLDTKSADDTGSFAMTIPITSKFLDKGLYSAQMYIDDVASDEIAYFDFSPDGSPVTHTAEESALLESSKIEFDLVESVSAKKVKLVDALGNEIKSVSVSQPVQISAYIENLEDQNQSFTYIVQVRDIRGATMHVSWISGMMTDDQIYNVALSWSPQTGGSYFADVYVWESMADAVSLSEPKTIPIMVV